MESLFKSMNACNTWEDGIFIINNNYISVDIYILKKKKIFICETEKTLLYKFEGTYRHWRWRNRLRNQIVAMDVNQRRFHLYYFLLHWNNLHIQDFKKKKIKCRNLNVLKLLFRALTPWNTNFTSLWILQFKGQK